MNQPMLDRRGRDELRAELIKLARSYTPEWRCDGAADDPGTALAELFCDMHYETVERLNALPEKLYLEFLSEIGFTEPDPASSRGILRFTPHSTLDEPARVAEGTQLFALDGAGENIVFETVHTIEASAAQLCELYYADGERDEIRRIDDFSHPRRFFDPAEGEGVQRHFFEIGEENVLRLDCPASVTLRLTPPAEYLRAETAERLASKDMEWYYFSGGEKLPFDEVTADNGCVILKKTGSAAPDIREDGRSYVCCEGKAEGELRFDRVELSSEPLEPCPAQAAFSGDIPISPAQGGECFTRRPAPYEMLYLRCDSALSKKGANAMLKLDLSFLTDEPPEEEVQYEYGANVIDLKQPKERKLDDVYVSGVLWEYFNGLGWRELPVTGDKNPFGVLTAGSFQLRFAVPDDLEETEVNAQTGLYLRVRVTSVEHYDSINQRWIVPFLHGASFTWEYGSTLRPATRLYSENNAGAEELDDCAGIPRLGFTALDSLDSELRAVYLRFEGSPHAMPLSLRFLVRAGARMEKLQWEVWTGNGFAQVQCIDGTEDLSRSGEVFLYITEPLCEKELFGMSGCWLRIVRTGARQERAPVVLGLEMNTVEAVQRYHEPEQTFDTDTYEAGKTIALFGTPVQQCEVWVDEMSRLSETEARAMAAEDKKRVRLETEGHRVTRCWVLWERTDDLTLCGAGDRVYTLDPFKGIVSFGNGVSGRVPPEGEQNIRVNCTSGGGRRGNVAPGEVNGILLGLPRVSTVENITPMSGGTDRWELDRIESLGNRRLRHQWRAASAQDYEDIVLELFPRVKHVRCFSGVNAEGKAAPGEVTVVVAGDGECGESMDRLCREVTAEISRRCSCCLVAEGRLHVRGALEIKVNTTVMTEVEDLDRAAETQYEISERIAALIGNEWSRRRIGEQLDLRELWSVVREIPNVRAIKRILAEGEYDENGVRRLVPLENDGDRRFAVALSGTHTVKLV